MSVYLNNEPVSAYGMVVTSMSGWLHVPTTEYPSVQLDGVPGSRLVAGMMPRTESRTIALTLYQNTATTLADRRAKLAEFASACRGLLEFSTAEDRDRFCRVTLIESNAQGILGAEQALVNPASVIEVRFAASDPYWYQRTPTLQSLPASTRVALTLGSAPCRGTIVVNQGGAGSGTVGARLRDTTGVITGEVTFAGVTLAAGDSLWIENALYEAWHYVSATGAWVLVTGALGLGEDFLRFDPLDRPTLELLNGYDGWVTYRKAEQL